MTVSAPQINVFESQIPDHQIEDLDSFNAVTSDPYQVAGLYFFYKLDCLIDLAYKVSHDFYDRPELFTEVTNAETLAKLHARYGCDESFLNKKERYAIYSALFGKCMPNDFSANEEDNFPNLRDALIDACAIFVETKFGDAPSLRENVRKTHRLVKEYLTGLNGASVSWSREHALSDLTEQVSYRILRDRGVSAVFGIATPARAAWPYTFDSNADKLVEKISKQLTWPEKSENAEKSGEMPVDGKHEMHKYISREQITNLQRSAIEGAKAIATVIDVDASSTDKDVDRLITKCYTWGTALKSLGVQKAVGAQMKPVAAPSSGQARPGTYARS